MEKLQADIIEAKKDLALQTYLKEIAEADTVNLKTEIQKLNEEINRLKKRFHRETRESSTQTDEKHDGKGTTKLEVAKEDSLVAPDLLENGIESLAETLRQTAENAVKESGYVMDMESGMYYDYKSGYYYDPKTSLLYDPHSATYFFYNEETNGYEFHSKVEVPESSKSQNQQDDQKLAWESKKKTKKKTKDKKKPEQLSKSAIPSSQSLSSSFEVDDRVRKKKSRRTKTKHRHKKHRKKTEKRDKYRKDPESTQKKEDDYINILDDELNICIEEGEVMEEGTGNRDGKIDGRIEPMEVNYKNRPRIGDEGMKGEEDGEEEEEEEGEHTEIERKEERGEDVVSEMEEGEVEDSSEEVDKSKDEEQEEESSEDTSGDDEEESDWSAVSSDEDDPSVEEEEEEEVVEPPVNPLDYPPCVRLIVTDSKCVAVGSLHIVTVMGGTIGREGCGHVVRLPEIAVSKQHAEISYCDQRRCYALKDLGSQNGTLLNGRLIASGRTLAKALDLTQNDILTIGSTTFEVHIHLGNWTCENCEPGLVQAKLTAQVTQKVEAITETKEDKETLRKKALKKMKKKYNLVGEEYRVKDVTVDGRYADRAEERRQTIGSDNPYQREDAPASVDRAIDESNKGHQLLLKMGWKEGDSLGKGNKGLKEPIQVGVHSGKAGLGSVSATTLDLALNRDKKISFSWKKAHQRFQQAEALYKGGGVGVDGQKATAPEFKMWVQGKTQIIEKEENVSVSASEGPKIPAKDKEETVAKLDMFSGE